MLCSFLVYSKVIQLYIDIYILFIFYYCLLQDIEYINSSLCCTVGPCCLSILYIIVGICSSQTPNPSLPHPPPPRQPQLRSLCL